MEGNLKMVKRIGFQNLLYVRFIIEKRYRVDEVARKLDIHKDTLYRWIRGDNPFPIDQLPHLVKATDDPIYLKYLAREAGFSLVEQVKDKKTAEAISRIADILISCINHE